MESRYSDKELEDIISVWIQDIGMSFYEDFTVILDRVSNSKAKLEIGETMFTLHIDPIGGIRKKTLFALIFNVAIELETKS